MPETLDGELYDHFESPMGTVPGVRTEFWSIWSSAAQKRTISRMKRLVRYRHPLFDEAVFVHELRLGDVLRTLVASERKTA